MICDIQSLGVFDGCDPIVIDFVESEITVKNAVTKWECLFPDGYIGLLSVGEYLFTYEGQKFGFAVV